MNREELLSKFEFQNGFYWTTENEHLQALIVQLIDSRDELRAALKQYNVDYSWDEGDIARKALKADEERWK